ncbi:MAG: NAD-dependent epimerase/dehydratase [Sphingomonas bacterium]|nr:NAD(P)H-binding protein [Sphingomonas bacterium]MDB5688281.1 NAD-dependent epimerase/dehydratase [Sphingomonas bacterium]
MTTLAITGGTGFVGRHLLRLVTERDWQARALARRPQEAVPSIFWVAGALDQPAGLARLVAGADAVIHVAGVVNAADRAGFAAGNIAGTAAVIAAARDAGIRRFVHVSSLAAREPGLSDYGWSKAESEKLVAESGLDWSIVRPPAVYGPGDMEMLDMFRMAARGIVALPPGGRLSVIAAQDLARLLLALAKGGTPGGTYEPDDGRPGGWSHGDFARALGAAVQRRVRTLAVPAALLRIGAGIDGLVRGRGAKLTPDRVRYFCHPDWVVDPGRAPPAQLWQAEIATPAGLNATAGWYRARGLLPSPRHRT